MKGFINRGFSGNNSVPSQEEAVKREATRVEGWDFFEEDFKDRVSVSERKYNKSLQKWYKILKVSSGIVSYTNSQSTRL